MRNSPGFFLGTTPSGETLYLLKLGALSNGLITLPRANSLRILLVTTSLCWRAEIRLCGILPPSGGMSKQPSENPVLKPPTK